MRNDKKFLEKAFSFLEKDFVKKVFTRNQEINILYSNNKTTITIIYDWGLDRKYFISVTIERKDLVNRPLRTVKTYKRNADGKYQVETIEEEENGKNLLECNEIFGKTQLEELKTQLNEKKVEEQIELYSKFIADNILKMR